MLYKILGVFCSVVFEFLYLHATEYFYISAIPPENARIICVARCLTSGPTLVANCGDRPRPRTGGGGSGGGGAGAGVRGRDGGRRGVAMLKY